MTQRVRKTISINESLLFEQVPGNRSTCDFPPLDVPSGEMADYVPRELLRDDIPGFPELNEVEVVRHYTRLSTHNYHVDLGLYPLGSCTMKYNPKINEKLARIPAFAQAHPLQLHENTQGCLKVLQKLADLLVKITGMDGVTLQPLAGAHGELTGMMLIRAALTARGNPRKKVLIPDSAHGTNPASAVLCGYTTVTLKSNASGCIDLDELRRHLDADVACLMMTVPNTLGVFEANIQEVARLVHANGSFLYMDGANFNAFIGVARPGDMGVDVMHLNLHKTFSTPHGGGGPGAGPVVVVKELVPFLPVPVVSAKTDGSLFLDYNRPQSIGRVAAFYGNFGILLRALAYILREGADGLRQVAENAVLNANYIRHHLSRDFHLEYQQPTLHEVVFDDKNQADAGVHTMDMAKRLLDLGFHPPTVYFPLIVPGAIMIEPTESESKAELDAFIDTMRQIAQEARESPKLLQEAPQDIRSTRFDEALAARKPVLIWKETGQA
ncbi:MAG TPA: aminomethyl-transferring glycine dehydrogenase subunit GcvPB [Acidobacteriota bacterium]|jgi:glycine dehydrogenase subunit 2|nr:aminomethyl-transferring glycine dehydrogenase subunit GcvPB [Acidobacteriota bacterium]HNR38815.1 aminomethyl-transferring glycine dehydrogenase subunit GcvPB [Acidobacteriota bacterium]HNU00336.1 aminomethyl-transferring glycine dehydrogenase subunit GcvPB [Acidobacteriota bacterium]HPB27203.1 aminomethyl-transferring glycine dehydrogenase subunit GcvPB [Acidobacteriota bacterium]HQO25008.1 aminomethyl-transferring glycine dehydrogenase subunit GcvPB [Acidobacteriota bacterium]